MKRFNVKFIKSENGCWNWIAATRGKTGYGAFKYKGKTVDSHRVSFLFYNGEIPDGLLVSHTCDNRLCVNPNHLFLGTHKDNYDDMVNKGRRPSRYQFLKS